MTDINSISEAIRLLSRYPKKVKHTKPRSSQSYIRLLKFIRSSEGALASELSQMMAIKPASLSEMLSNLEKDLLITRQRDAKDKRKHRFYLTDLGHNHLFIHKHQQYDVFKDILSEDEEQVFINLCQKLMDYVNND